MARKGVRRNACPGLIPAIGFFWILALLAPPSAAKPPAERDWSAALREDAQALHADIAANHPGPVNREDPGFAGRNDAQLALALKRARDARSYADYFFALREYVSSFDDGHMGFGAYGDTPNDFSWPGFLTNYDARSDVRIVLSEDVRVPVGAKLLGCDGMTAKAYAAATLGKMWGRWHLESQRRSFGEMLFLNEGSRYIPRARRCRFDVEGEPRAVALQWRPIPIRDLLARLKGLSAQISRNFDTRVLNDGIRWYGIPSFDGHPQSAAGKALPAMIAAMRSDRAALVAAPAIVLDLRGNGGGSSDWSRQIAEVLWGRAAIERLKSPKIVVDWRVSPANLEAIEQGYAERDAASLSPEMRNWHETVIKGMRTALGRGQRLWRHPDGKAEQNPIRSARKHASTPPLGGPVYFLTDSSCGSACLDAVDLWRALGAIHVGQTTSADTLYMELRRRKLPSGIGGVSIPMKVYRGRPRGSNEPVVPLYSFDGDIGDTAAVQHWIKTLASTARR